MLIRLTRLTSLLLISSLLVGCALFGAQPGDEDGTITEPSYYNFQDSSSLDRFETTSEEALDAAQQILLALDPEFEFDRRDDYFLAHRRFHIRHGAGHVPNLRGREYWKVTTTTQNDSLSMEIQTQSRQLVEIGVNAGYSLFWSRMAYMLEDHDHWEWPSCADYVRGNLFCNPSTNRGPP